MAFFVVLVGLAGLASAADVWWEGEDTAETNFPRSTWFDAQNAKERDKLSEGDWLTNDGEQPADAKPAFARYNITVPEDGKYQLWTRKFYKHGPFRWRFDERDWKTCGRNIALADSVTLRTHVVANWVHLGEVELERGKHQFEFELLAKAGEKRTSAFDAFLLTTDAFTPRGKLKPGQRSGLADPGFFAWEPAADPFDDTAMLDLRHLNEAKAGQNGYVRRAGDDFQLGDGTPVRFWAVNVSHGNISQSRDSIDYLARKLAKLGVNMVRFHGGLFAGYEDPKQINTEALDNLQYFVHAMAEQGIYTKISFYFPIWFDAKKAGFEGFDTIDNNKPFALLYFNPKMQAVYYNWLETILTAPSKYDDVPLGRNPAVAIVEIINEDSFFFWTFRKRNFPPVHWKRLEAMYAKATGEPAALEDAWHMTSDGLAQKSEAGKKRIAKQVEFLTKLQRDFYDDTARRMKQWGYRGLVSASNWHVTDGAKLDALERYTYTAGDVIDRHGYFQGKHEGEGSGHSVRTGHVFENLSGLRVPHRTPITVQQIAGHPHTISELNWPNPNRFRTEATTMTAAYAALQGIDGIFWFAVGSNAMADQSMGKFQVAGPAITATLPANALIYRKRLIAESDPVINEIIRLKDLYALKGSASGSDQALDALRQADIPEGRQHVGQVSGIDPLTFFAGRVQRTIGDRPERSTQADLTSLIDRDAKRVRSITGELDLDYGQGVLRIDTPQAQGAAGFLADADMLRIGQIAIDCDNEFATVLVVSLDDQPIATSRRLLIQAMTEVQPYGFKTEGNRIADVGGPPLGVREIDCTVTLAGPIRRVIALDENGYATRRPVTFTDNQITLRQDAVWHIVER